jgi:ribosomal protein S18 acetylase RimI-like enzyme
MTVNDQVLGQATPSVAAKLNDSNAEAFYALNYEELRALSSNRVEAAVKRLSLAEPVQLRKDITVRLVALLREKQDAQLYDEVAKALAVWSEEGDGAAEVMAGIAVDMRAEGEPIPEQILSFLAERRLAQAATILVELWAQNPSTRQSLLQEYGSGVAAMLVPYLESEIPAQARSAATLLGSIGGPAQLPAMREILQGAINVEFRDVLAESIARIENR